MFPSIALGFALLWLISTTLLWSTWLSEKQRIRFDLEHEGMELLGQKAIEIESILQQIYHVGRTISLLPGVRSNVPEEDESEEYSDYVRQLDYLRQNHYRMPPRSVGEYCHDKLRLAAHLR